MAYGNSARIGRAFSNLIATLTVAVGLLGPIKISDGIVPLKPATRQEIVLFEEKADPVKLLKRENFKIENTTNFAYVVDESALVDSFYVIKDGKIIATDGSKVAIGRPWSAPSLSGTEPSRNQSITNRTFAVNYIRVGPRYYNPDISPEARLSDPAMREDISGNPNPRNPYGTYLFTFFPASEYLANPIYKYFHATNEPNSLGRDASHGCIRHTKAFMKRTTEYVLKVIGVKRKIHNDWRAFEGRELNRPILIRLQYNPIKKVAILPGVKNDTLAVSVNRDPYGKAPEMLRQALNIAFDANLGHYSNCISFTWGKEKAQGGKSYYFQDKAYDFVRGQGYSSICRQFAAKAGKPGEIRVPIPKARPINNTKYFPQKTLTTLQ